MTEQTSVGEWFEEATTFEKLLFFSVVATLLVALIMIAAEAGTT